MLEDKYKWTCTNRRHVVKREFCFNEGYETISIYNSEIVKLYLNIFYLVQFFLVIVYLKSEQNARKLVQ
jgi:hypothetical protein